jgi:hypothetical protein
MQLFIQEYTSVVFESAMDRYRYYQSKLLVMLATDSIDTSVKKFTFLTDSIDHRSQKKIFLIKLNHRLKISFSSKDHQCNRCFLQLSIISIDPINVFLPSVPTYAYWGGGGLSILWTISALLILFMINILIMSEDFCAKTKRPEGINVWREYTLKTEFLEA